MSEKKAKAQRKKSTATAGKESLGRASASAKPARKGAKTQSTGSLKAPLEFSPVLGELDLHLFGEGKHERIYEKLGAHLTTHEGKRGVAFAVWAPNAKNVSVVGNFNDWNGANHPMRRRGDGGGGTR